MPNNSSGQSAGAVLDPYRSYIYRITIAEGGIVGHFNECSGIELVTERIVYPEGGRDGREHQLVGPTHYLPVELGKGVISNDSMSLWSWMEKTRKSHRDKRSVMLDYLGPEPNDVFGYVLEEAWICGWQSAQMSSSSREIAVERITIAYDSVSRRKG